MRHYCHAGRLDIDGARELLSLGEFVCLAFPSTRPGPYPYWFAVKARANLEERELPYVADSPEEAVRAIYDARGMAVARCSLYPIYHIVAGTALKERRATERDEVLEEGMRW
jgi:hypothetical protein